MYKIQFKKVFNALYPLFTSHVSQQVRGISILFKGKLKLVPSLHWQLFIHIAQISLHHCMSG